MGKKLRDLKWESVAFDGFSDAAKMQNFEGFVGLEECHDYALDMDSKTFSKKKKKQKKTKSKSESTSEKLNSKPASKKSVKTIQLQNGFTVEPCGNSKPSNFNEISSSCHINDEAKGKPTIKNKAKLGENPMSKTSLGLQDMQAWLQYQIPDEIMKALAEQGFANPTRIQELTLPSAMFGRRDILGAAETGSGKTLAFGIPILCGIMKLKEKLCAGEDIYNVPYKKSSIKRRGDSVTTVNSKKPKIAKKLNKKSQDSSEEGYVSESDNYSNISNNTKNDKDYLEEYDVPIKKREVSAKENESDDDEDYVHLSEMIDSDDLAQSSDDDSYIDNDESENDTPNDETDSQNEYDHEMKKDVECAKVIDDLDLPDQKKIVRSNKPLYALIVTPTRELAIQISRHLTAAAKYTGIRIATIVGGMASVKQERVLSRCPEVVVATPGRLWELCNQGQPHLQNMECLKFLAIDETDRMVERNHFEELHPLLERINADENSRRARQNFVFSATLTMVHDLPSHMKGKKVTKRGKVLNRKVQKMTAQQKLKKLIDMIGMTDPKVVDITSQNSGTAENLTECRITCALEEKDIYLYYILKRHPGRTIVFCNSIGSVKRLAQLFGLLQCKPLPLHASMPQRQRLKNLERFRDDPHGVLIATDVAARGLDIPNVDHVVHYQVPRTAENYVHRSGRTARASKEGLTILIMEPGEAFLYSKLCRTLNRQSELPIFPIPTQMLTPMKGVVKLARELDRLQLSHSRCSKEQGWLDKAARELDIIIDEDFIPTKQYDRKISKELQLKKKQLETMLSQPIFPRGFSYKYPTLNETDVLKVQSETKAIDVMKNAINSGKLKKLKRTSKNSPLLNLGKNVENK